MRPAQKRGKYITQRRFRGFCDLSSEWTYILPITVKLVLCHVNIFLQSGYMIGSWSKFSNHWMTETNWEKPTQPKLSYANEEPQSAPGVIYEPHV